MSKIFYCIVCAVAAVYLGNVLAFEPSVREKILNLTAPIVDYCASLHEVPYCEIEEAQACGREVQDLDPCFLACMLKETNVLSQDGVYNTDTALNVLSDVLGVEAGAIYAKRAKYCGYVNNQTYCDGSDGCEIAKAIMICFRLQDIDIVFTPIY